MKLRTLSCQFRNRVSCRNCERRNWHAENTRELEKRVTNCCVTPINNEKSRKKRVVVLNPRSESCGKCHLNCTKTAPSRNVCKCVCFLLVPNKMVALFHGSLRFVPGSKGVSIMGHHSGYRSRLLRESKWVTQWCVPEAIETCNHQHTHLFLFTS